MPTTAPVFSIIIPTLNEAATLANTLAPLQRFRPQCEIIVVDGASHDATVTLAIPYADQVLVAPKGRAAQMNCGAHAARGTVLLFLHADTQLPPEALTLITQAMTNKRVWGRFDVMLNSRHSLLKLVAFMMNWRSRITGIATGDQAIFVSRDAFQSVNGYTEQPLMEDIDLSVKLRRLSRPACLHEHVVTSARRWDKFGVINTILLMWSLRLGYFLGATPETLAYLYQQGKLWKPSFVSAPR